MATESDNETAYISSAGASLLLFNDIARESSDDDSESSLVGLAHIWRGLALGLGTDNA